MKAAAFKKHRIVIRIVLGVVLVSLISWGVVSWLSQPKVDRSTYQLVKLLNGEIYFGKITQRSAHTIALENVYVKSDANQTSSNGTNQVQNTNDAALALLKLSDTVAKPKGPIYINSDQVVYWQNLEGDSNVMKAINDAASQ